MPIISDFWGGWFSFGEIAWNTARMVGSTSKASTTMAARILLRRIPKMVNLTTVVVGCYGPDDWRMFKKASAFATAAWTHALRLQSLTLDVPLDVLGHVLSSMPNFSSLQEFKITLRFMGLVPSHHDLLGKTARFINRHSPTLTSLSVDVINSTINSSPLFQALDTLPLLRSMTLGYPIDRMGPTIPTGIGYFLKKHTRELKELRLQLHGSVIRHQAPSPSVIFQHHIFQQSLPCLTLLDLGLCQWEHDSRRSVRGYLTRYVSGFKGSLTTLIIRDFVFGFSDLRAVVEAIGGQQSILRRFQLHTHYLSCGLLDLLSRSLPNLYHLDLLFDSIVRNDNTASWYPNAHRLSCRPASTSSPIYD